MRRLFFGCLCAVAVFFALFVSSAGAVDIIESQEPGGVVESPEAGWQAGLCSQDENAEGKLCSSKTPELFFEQAAGHPPDAFTQVQAKEEEFISEIFGPLKQPVGSIKTLLVDLPVGLSVNAQATPQCELELNGEGKEVVPAAGCPEETRVGSSTVTAKISGFR